MARCSICNRWKFSFMLCDGVCAACSVNATNEATQDSCSIEVDANTAAIETAPLTNRDITPIAPETPPAPKKREPKKYRVTGMSHYEDNLIVLAIEDDNYSLSKKGLIEEGLIGERVWKYFFSANKTELIPEPDNPVDPKAIKVVVDGQHVGYIKSGSCAHLLKAIRENRIKSISCEIFGGPYKFIDEDYDEERDKEVYTLDKGNAPYAVHLTIDEE